MTILIVDDSTLIRSALRSTIEHNTALCVCGEAENGKIAVDQVKKLRAYTVILYLQMPVMNALEAARQIAEMAPGPVMLMDTVHCSEQLLKDAQAADIQKVLLQESLTNVHRHSGASRVHVQLTPEKQRLTLTVRDFGSGMPAETLAAFQRNGGNGGVGLTGMRERVNDLGGLV